MNEYCSAAGSQLGSVCLYGPLGTSRRLVVPLAPAEAWGSPFRCTLAPEPTLPACGPATRPFWREAARESEAPDPGIWAPQPDRPAAPCAPFASRQFKWHVLCCRLAYAVLFAARSAAGGEALCLQWLALDAATSIR